MRDLAAITAVYAELATTLDAQLIQAERAADAVGIARVAHKQRIHDSAYFILI